LNIDLYLNSLINHERTLSKEDFRNFRIQRVKDLLHLMGDPHKSLKCIHIVGSKGKGSTAVLIAKVLKHANYKVGLYTSPHLNTYLERIRIFSKENKGRLISKSSLAGIVRDYYQAIEHIKNTQGLTFFELFTAVALVYFKRQNVDIAILEAGLGGRLDATNVVDALISVVTAISLEHTNILGNSLDSITKEKIAVVKGKEFGVVSARQNDVVDKIINDHCKKKRVKVCPGLRINVLKKDFDYQTFDVLDEKGQLLYLKLQCPLLGSYQISNLEVALGIIDALKQAKMNISDKAVSQGIKNVFWPGRFEIVKKDPIIILDGAHNEASAKSLVTTIKEYFVDKRVILILGICEDKDCIAIGRVFNKIVSKVLLPNVNHSRIKRLSEDVISKMFDGKEFFYYNYVTEALDYAEEIIEQDEIILISGSLFIVSEAREYVLKR